MNVDEPKVQDTPKSQDPESPDTDNLSIGEEPEEVPFPLKDNCSVLFNNVRVYAIAEKYEILPLKELARERFATCAENNWSCEEFPAILREVVESTPNTDRGLRDIVSQLVAEHIQKFLDNEDFLHLLEDSGELGLDVLRQVLSIKSEELDSAMTSKAASEANVAELVSRVIALEATNTALTTQLEEHLDNLTAKMKKINELILCRHCGEAFNTCLEGHDGKIVIVRCAKCRTRHY